MSSLNKLEEALASIKTLENSISPIDRKEVSELCLKIVVTIIALREELILHMKTPSAHPKKPFEN